MRKLIGICVVVLLQAVGAFADPCFSELFEFQLPMGPSFDPLIEGADGNFYGTSVGGGAAGLGAVFRMTPAGVITPLTYFNSTNGANPWSSLVRTPDGTLYGTTSTGGKNLYGTVFKLSPDGTLTNLISFAQTNGAAPSTLLLGDDGLLWGIATTWGPPGRTSGAIFKVSTNGNPTFVVFFDGTNGSRPSSLLKGPEGNFYGTTGGGGGINGSGYGTIFKLTPAGVLNTLAVFNSTNGDSPTGLCLGVDGNFYGTTLYGGTNNAGTVFKVSPSGTFTKLLDLTGYNQMPNALVRGNDGNFYGTSYNGGQGYGTVFRVTPQGVLTTLVSFNSANGSSPQAGMMLASDGNFYGTTMWGGMIGQGTIFRMTPAGVLTILSSFSPLEGYRPAGAVTLGRDGNYYGTTQQGGFYGSGTVFRLTPAGEITTLVAFHDTNGISPAAPLLLASDGNFYGTTTSGGAGFNGEPNTGYGTVFRITTNGEFSTVCSFTMYTGSFPKGRLAQDDDGNFYGTMTQGGGHSAGSVFKVSPSGTLTNLAPLDYYYAPQSGLVRGPDGNFYGTT
ncbi:MAG: choice-of-anchor tandem repeat GloVer-containing protein, partial [Limisphaerales bacterium]